MSLYKVAAFYLFKTLIYIVRVLLAHEDIFFVCNLEWLGMPNWSVIIFEAWAYFQLLEARNKYKALTILRLST